MSYVGNISLCKRNLPRGNQHSQHPENVPETPKSLETIWKLPEYFRPTKEKGIEFISKKVLGKRKRGVLKRK